MISSSPAGTSHALVTERDGRSRLQPPERAMANVHWLARKQVISPDDLRVAADAFEAALLSLPEDRYDLARHLLARYVIEHALAGQRDFTRLRDGALDFVRREASKQVA